MGLDSQWTNFHSAIATSKGSGSALYKLHDFTLAITQSMTNCNMQALAGLLDQAFTSNILATLIRFVAQFNTVVTAWESFTSYIQAADYTNAGYNLGIVALDLLG
jgi:hypothetical protein